MGVNFLNIKASKDYGTWYLLALSSILQNDYTGYLLHNCCCLYDLEARAKFTEEWLESEDGELICPSRCSAPTRTGRAGRPTAKELSHLKHPFAEVPKFLLVVQFRWKGTHIATLHWH